MAPAGAACWQGLVQAGKEKQVDIVCVDQSADPYPGTGSGQAGREEA